MVKVITTTIFVKMEMAQGYWEENSNIQPIKYDGNLNFSTATCSEDDCEYGPFRKNKMPRQDPMSHRIIEKRRRDRMNNCLADLSRLIPTEYLKKGRGRIEKTEIIEMAIKHMKFLQQEQIDHTEYYRSGYQECMSEAVKFMTEIEGHFSRESLCIKLLNHLQKHCDQISKLQPMEHPNLHFSEKLSNLNNANNQHHTFAKVNNNDEISRCANSNDAFQCNMSKIMDSECSSDAPPVEYVNTKTETIYEKPPVDTNGVSYKYKTDIKHRFNQEKIVHNRRNSVTSIDESPCQNSSGSSECRVSDCEAASHRVPSDTTSNSSDRCMSTVKRKAEVDDNFSVPIFVLHSKGSYYVPSSVDYKTLLPHLKNFNILDLPSMENLVLHPVNINVNYLPHFNGQQNGASKQYKWSQKVL